jgi:hypothetical protein
VAALQSEEDGFAEFRNRWERPLLHAVFTAHPTFLLSPAESDAVAEAALAHPDKGVEELARKFLHELAEEGDPYAVEILRRV